MTTPGTTGNRHWSHMLRYLAPGPVPLGLGAYVNPTVWRVMRTTRRAAQPPARYGVEVRRTER